MKKKDKKIITNKGVGKSKNEVKVIGWINAYEELPEYDERVLINFLWKLKDDEEVCTCIAYRESTTKQGETYVKDDGGKYVMKILYWRPIPKSPLTIQTWEINVKTEPVKITIDK